MTTDNPNFFDDLERELVAATSDRTRRLRRARARRAATLSTVAVAVLAAGGGLAAALTTSDANNNSAAPATTTPTVNGERLVPPLPSGTPKRGTYRIAVLNGTTVPGLARGVANRLSNSKYKVGTVTNAATQDRAATLVEFAPGHRAEAEAVANVIDVAPDAIQQESAASRAIAGEGTTVVVTVGSDQNTAPRTSP
jgi:hypothetical protein